MSYDVPVAAAKIAHWQAGVISRRQLLEAGLSSQLIKRRLERGRWQQLHRGVYAVFNGPAPRGTWLWAAVLRAGDGAVLSHHTAAELHGLIDSPAGSIHVTVPSTRRITAPGLVIRMSGRVGQARQPNRDPPRTSVEETVLDLAELARTFDDACAWITKACGKRLTTEEKLRAALALRKKMRWRNELDDVLAAAGDGIHSVLEYRYVRDVERAHGLPRSRHQVRDVIDGKVVYRDAYYEKYRVAVELDGKLAHPDDERWRDSQRDNQATARDVQTVRYGWRDVYAHACETALLQAQILRRRGWPGTPRPCSANCPVGQAWPSAAPGPEQTAKFLPIASTGTAALASHLMRLGESGTPSLSYVRVGAAGPDPASGPGHACADQVRTHHHVVRVLARRAAEPATAGDRCHHGLL
jgi:predicted transcriptional regulator of viral defense system